MAVEFQITSNDYTSAGMLNGQVPPMFKKIHYVVDALLIILSVAALYFEYYSKFVGLIGAVFLGHLFPLIYRQVFAKRQIMNHYKKYKLIQQMTSVSIVEKGILIKAEFGQFLIEWKYIHSWKENDALLLVYIAPNLYYILPKRISEIGFPMEKLKERLIECVGNAT